MKLKEINCVEALIHMQFSQVSQIQIACSNSLEF